MFIRKQHAHAELHVVFLFGELGFSCATVWHAPSFVLWACGPSSFVGCCAAVFAAAWPAGVRFL